MKQTFINTLLGVITLIFLQLSCKNEKSGLLYQKWKTVSLQNTTMDKEIREMKAYIDTIGDHDPEVRAAMDLDSAKMILQANLDKSMNEQKLAQDNTLMEFKSNGVSYTTSIEGVDSAMFTVEDNFIKIDEAKLKGYGETMTFEILKLNKDTLQLRMVDYGDTSVVTMIPVRSN